MAKGRSSVWRRWIRRGFVVGGVLLVTAWGLLEVGIRSVELPEGLGEVHETVRLLDRGGGVISESGNAEARSWRSVKLAEVDGWVIRATLAAEDRRFYQHSGVDVVALGGSLWRNVTSGRVVSGASTITQQLIKLHAGGSQRGWKEKVVENLAALKLERKWGKQRILEAYLNRIDYGNRLRGIEAAAQGYFAKAAADLEPMEAVFLAGLPQAPSRYNPWTHPEAAASRYRQVLRYLEMEDAEVPSLADRGRSQLAPHFSRHVLGRAYGAEIRSTLDSDLQAEVLRIVEKHTTRLRPSGVSQIAVVVLDHRTGKVKAWCGSSDWEGKGGQIDGVITARSSGSTLKPFLYLRAIDEGLLTAASLVPDTPDAIRAEYADYDPRNYDERFWGPVRVREALANSLNIPAVHVLAQVGARDFHRFLSRSGIPLKRGLDEYGAGMILGNGEVRLLDLTAGFGAFANGGVYVAPRFREADPVRHIAISGKGAAAVLTDILSDNDARLKTFGLRSPLAFEGVRVPCKTGTSSGFHDAWTVGATGRHVVGVWVGNFDGRAMDEVASVTGPAPVWREIIDLLLPEDGGVMIDPADAGLVSVEICTLSGLLGCPESPGKLVEWFLPGSEPTEEASGFFRNGKIVLPAEYALWCKSGHNYLAAEVSAGGELKIIQPMDGSVFLLDADLPAERQEIEFIAVGGEEVRWEIDGEEFGGGFWRLSPGRYHVKATLTERVVESVFEVK
ncbi:MAG: penicillin-binding protein 1C [Luteolibacter sp.]